jgi:HlyD family secretion protein
MRRRGWRWLLLVLLAAAAAGLCAALAGPSLSPSSPPRPEPGLPPARVSALGRLAPEDEVIAVSPGTAGAGGRVDQISVEVGDRVSAGQVVAVLDTYHRRAAAVREATAAVSVSRAKLAQVRAGPKPDDVQAQEALIDRCQAEFQAAQRDLGRATALLRKAASSRQDFDDQTLKYQQTRHSLDQAKAQLAALKAIRPTDLRLAEAELAHAEATLDVAQAELEAAQVRSPISGRVLRIRTWPGERVGEQGILDVGNTDRMYAVAEVYEEDIGKVHVGQAATVRVPTLGTQLPGEVVRKDLVVSRKAIFNNDPVADIDARVIEVRIRLSQRDSTVVSGLSNARAEVVIDTSKEVK